MEDNVTTGWLKGSLPSWLIAALLAFSLFSATKWFNDLEDERKQFSQTLVRHQGSIAVIQGKVTVLERGQDLMLQELRGIREELQRRR